MHTAQHTPDTTEFKLKIQGSPNMDGYNVIAFHIDRTINKVPYADVFILDGNVADQKFAQSNGSDFVPGNTITLLAGDTNLQKEIFKGIIVSQKIKQNENGTSLQLKIKDTSVRMTVGRKNAYFYEKTDTEILEDILKQYGSKEISFDIEDPKYTVTHTEMVQYYCTDWDFMVSRAEASGRVVMVENGKVIIKTPEVSFDPSNFTLTFGDNTYNFEAEMDGRDEFANVTAISWDNINRTITKKPVFSVQNFSTEGNISPQALAKEVIDLNEYLMQHGGNLNPVELELWAYSKMLRSRLSKIRGTARVIGNADLKPGDNINISKFSNRFNGPAFVSGIRHEMTGNSTWFTDIQFGYSQEWFAEKHTDIIDRPAAGLVPAINGLMIGIVTAIGSNDDPEKNYRVRVKMPMVDNESEGVWARVSTLDAGEKHGVFFRPEVNDEVLLGFLDDDPRQPIIIGSLFSSGNADPEITIKSDNENFQKGIFTKSGMKLVFDDDKETILISTNNDENQILITAKDEPSIVISDKNKNKIEMNKDGILIESCKDIILKADKGDVKMDGINMELAAQAQFKAEGTSGAEISSSGSTVVKGSIIQIN